MATQGVTSESGFDASQPLTAEDVAVRSPWHPLAAAAVVGGTIAAGGAAYWGTRALARRNGARDGKPVNSVMATAITACDVKPE